MSKWLKFGVGLSLLFTVLGLLLLFPQKPSAATQQFSHDDWDNASLAFPLQDTSKVIASVGGVQRTFLKVSVGETVAHEKYHLYKPVESDFKLGTFLRIMDSELSKSKDKESVGGLLFVIFICNGDSCDKGSRDVWPGDNRPPSISKEVLDAPDPQGVINSAIKNTRSDMTNVSIHSPKIVVSITKPANGATVKGKNVKIHINIKSAGISTEAPKIEVGGGVLHGPKYASAPKSVSFDVTWDSTTVSDGTYDILASAKDKNGKSDSDRITIKTKNGISSEDDATCESSSNIGLEWIVCPLLRGIDKIVTSIYGEVDKQLCFVSAADKASLTDNPGCAGNNNLTPEVKQTWSLVRNLASALLVIVMLIMVFAQAIGSGPFDAYTVKKMLPKLAAAAIFIQLSWIASRYAIDLTNDIGRGIKGLLFLPFPSYVGDIDHALRNIGTTGTLGATTMFVGLVATAAFSGLTILGTLFLALSGVAAVFVGLLVLLFRKALIILCVIFAPIALIMWVLPGTERYWKLWRETFFKLLMMFPLIAAMIAAGRIFGYIAGTAGGGIMALLAVMVGFFGPLFILPKTYKWGGNALGTIGGAVIEGSRGFRKKPREYAMRMAGENRQFRAQQRATRLAQAGKENRSRWDRLLAGDYNFARKGAERGELSARQAAFSKTLAEGQRATTEGMASVMLAEGVENWAHGPSKDEHGKEIKLTHNPDGTVTMPSGYVKNKLDFYESMLRGQEYMGIKPTEALAGYAFDQLAKLGDPDRIRAARVSSSVGEHVWTQAVARNFPKLNEIMRDYTLAPDLSKLNPRQFSTQDADTVEELVRQVKGKYITDRATGKGQRLTETEAKEQKERAVALAEEIRNNDLLWADLAADHRNVINELLTLRGEDDVRVVPSTRGKRAEAITPEPTEDSSGTHILSDLSKENLTRALTDSSTRPTVIMGIAERLANPSTREPYLAYVKERLRDKTMSSEDATAIYNQIAQTYHDRLDTGVKEYEREQLASGVSKEVIAASLTDARRKANEEKTLLPTIAPTSGTGTETEVRIDHTR